MKAYEARLDDEDAAELLAEVADHRPPSSARVVGLAPVLRDADEDAFDRLLEAEDGHVDEEVRVENDEASDVAALLPGAMRVVLSTSESPVFVRYDDDTTFFVGPADVADRYGASEASGAEDRGVVREMQADAEAEEALEDR